MTEGIIKKVQEGSWSVTLWEPKVAGKKPKISLQYGYKAPGREWYNQNIWFFERNFEDLEKVIKAYKDANKI